MRPLPYLLLAAALIAPSAAFAAPTAPLPSEIRLSDAEKEKVLEEAAAAAKTRRSPAAAGVEDDGATPPQIHGEVGFGIGTGGYRSAYGTAIIPLDDMGVAIISLDTTDFGDRRHPGPWRR